jgi:hypothetical protein
LALEELLEAVVEDHAGAETVGLVFVERRITAIALHNYFIHRSQEIERGKWVKATILRKAASRQIPGVSVRTSDHSQFDDSCDDPFVAFQQEQHPSGPQSHSLPQTQTKTTSTPETNREDQFMDADDDSCSVAQGCKNGTFPLLSACMPLRLDAQPSRQHSCSPNNKSNSLLRNCEKCDADFQIAVFEPKKLQRTRKRQPLHMLASSRNKRSRNADEIAERRGELVVRYL